MNKHGGYFGQDKNNVIDFSVNINPLGVPKKLIEKLKLSLENLQSYPEIDGESAKNQLSEKLNISSDSIILGNGATELIYLFSKTFKPKKVMIIEPTFTEYERAFKINGSNIYHFKTLENQSFKINIKVMLDKIDKVKPDLLVMCNPNNPTGVFTEFKNMIPVFEKLKKMNSYIFIDESFIDFTEKKSYISFIDKYPVFILRSMTKIYSIPGLRLGYALANKSMIGKLNKYKEPWTINSLALESIGVLIDDDDYIEKTNRWYSEEKLFLKKQLDKIDNIKVYESEGNFFLCKLKNINSKDMKKQLLFKNIYIRTCEDFHGLGDEYIRLAVRTREENTLLTKYIDEILLFQE